MKKNADIYYPIKVWLLSIFGGPVGIFIFGLDEDPIKHYVLIFLYGLSYSVPSLIISMLVYNYLLNRNLNGKSIKVILIIVGFILFTATFSFMGHPLWKINELEGWTLPIAYSCFFILGSIIFKVERNKRVIA